MVLPALGGAVTANFTSVSTVPVTAESYTAIGNTVSLSLGFMPPTGTDLMVVKNTGIAFITGRFSNLAQGQVVNLADNGVTYKYVANYYGGTGNDLVLHWAYQDLSAWGCNNYCQLGNNSTTNSSVPIIVNQSGVLAGKTVIAVAGGGYQDGAYDTLALCSDGTLASWGYNGYGQLGNNSYTDSHVPGLVTQNGVLAGKTVVSISAGYHHSLALCSDGTVAAWGWNSNGQLGNNSATNSSVPVLVTASGALAGKTVVSIAAGGTFSLALCSDGTVAGWGWNAYGQLGTNSATSSSVPVLATQSGVLAGKTVISVAAGYSHSLAVCSDGTVAAWGSNYYGQLGNNSSANSSVPVLISQSGVLAGKTIISASAGWIHSVALCSDGTIVAWGYNASGCLGNNSTTDSGVPVLVTQSGILVGKTGVSVAAGTYYSLALCSDGTMAAWGQNSFGNLGNNSTNNSSVPVLVDQSGVLASKTVTSITSGGFHSLALAAIQNSSNLTNLTLSSGTLSPAFAAATTSYTASVPNATTSITVTPTLSDATATVKVKGTTVTPGTASGAISLVVGTNVITTVVTAQDGTTTKSYTVNVTRISNVATLSGLSLNSGTLSPTFAAGSTSYAASVPNATTSITVRPTVTDTTATIKVNGTTVASGTASGLIELSVGANVITTVITAQDGVTTNTYTVTVTRNSNISTLSGLVLGSGTLSPTFAVGTLSYTGSVPNATSSITVTPTVTDPNATIKVNGTTVASGVASQSIPMVAGSNSINVVGTAQDGTTLSTYTVTVTRAFFEAVFTSATTVPISASGYNATGNGVNLTLGFAPPTGTDLMVVKNTGLAFITGQFSNLTQGQVVNLTYNGVTYKYVANYYGGTGNDLVLHWAYQDLATWGYNEFGQLGNNSFTDSGVPVLATQSGVLAGKTVVSVSAGIWHCLALCSDGTVAAWGDDLEGELGNNRATNSSVPVLVTQSGVLAGKTVIAVDTCGWHSLALCSDGTVAAWGANTLGQLGNGSTTNSSVPVLVNQSGVLAGKTVVQIAAGADFNLALCSDGSLATWGYDTTNQYNVPVLVTQSGVLAGKAVVSISGGRCHSLALCSDGTLVAWGYGWSGQLGNNSTTDSSAPVLVTQSGVLAGKTIISVAAGTAHNLALCSDGTLAAWGWNVAGQLGNNSTTDSLVPVLVTQSGVLAGKTVVSISAGQTLSLALCSDGTLAAWGFSGIGLLGNGGTTDSSVPVLVTQSGVLAGKMVGTVSTGGSSGIALAAVPNTSNQLSNLTLSAGTLSPTFDPATIAYTASVLYATSSITVTPTSAANVASVSVNGTPVTTGSMSQAFPLAVGSNIITTVVTAPDGVTTKTYTVTVTRAAPPVVTNISVAQRAGTRLVDITYDMTADFPTVWVGLEISMDGGATYSVATTTVSGAVGAGVAPGTGRVITWDAGADWNGQSTSLMCFKVTAIDTLSNFSLIPQGSFQMGNAMAADTDITDAPIRTVNVSAFYMGRNLVTKTDWDTVRTWGQSHGYTDLTVGAGKAANHPVQTITWYDTVKWCNARSEMEGLTPCYYTDAAQTVVYRAGNADLASTMVKWAANGYRLPTVAEWEKAARGGLSGKRFPWGDTISESQANYYGNTGNSYDLGPNGHNSIGSIGGTDPYTSPVGSFPANGYGLYDMAGNVFKWCWDWYGPYAAGAQTDPRGAATGNARVILGGDWSYGAGYCRVAYRSPFNPPTNSQYNTGFRVARSVVMPDPAVFSLIPAGSFQMGNAMAADTDITDAPIRTVTTSAFYMARNLVTKAAWDTVRTWGLANGYTDLSAGAGKASNHPVQTITWYDMVKWCNARSEMEGLTPCYTLRGCLPDEQ